MQTRVLSKHTRVELYYTGRLILNVMEHHG